MVKKQQNQQDQVAMYLLYKTDYPLYYQQEKVYMFVNNVDSIYGNVLHIKDVVVVVIGYNMVATHLVRIVTQPQSVVYLPFQKVENHKYFLEVDVLLKVQVEINVSKSEFESKDLISIDTARAEKIIQKMENFFDKKTQPKQTSKAIYLNNIKQLLQKHKKKHKQDKQKLYKKKKRDQYKRQRSRQKQRSRDGIKQKQKKKDKKKQKKHEKSSKQSEQKRQKQQKDSQILTIVRDKKQITNRMIRQQ